MTPNISEAENRFSFAEQNSADQVIEHLRAIGWVESRKPRWVSTFYPIGSYPNGNQYWYSPSVRIRINDFLPVNLDNEQINAQFIFKDLQTRGKDVIAGELNNAFSQEVQDLFHRSFNGHRIEPYRIALIYLRQQFSPIEMIDAETGIPAQNPRVTVDSQYSLVSYDLRGKILAGERFPYEGRVELKYDPQVDGLESLFNIFSQISGIKELPLSQNLQDFEAAANKLGIKLVRIIEP